MPESRGDNGSIKGSVDLERQKAIHDAGNATEQCSRVVHVQVSVSTSTSPATSTGDDVEDEMDAHSSLTNQTSISTGRSTKLSYGLLCSQK